MPAPSAQPDDMSNQSPPFVDVDLFGSDRPLMDAVAANGGGGEFAALSEFGQRWGSAEFFALAQQANEHVPQLRADGTVEFDPAYHHFMRESMAAGLHAMTWQADGKAALPPAEVSRAARYYMVAGVENGHMCPITMTRAAVGALAAEPALLTQLMPRIAAREYDPRFCPWPEKTSMTLGMGMTEKQGGTDVRTNMSRAVPAGDGYAITGHKWFMSAPMCDAFLVLAQAPGGLTCFLMPRFRPDGTVNGLNIQKLKDKLGNRSNASSEVEFADAFAWRVGAEGRGIQIIIQMVQLTRLDCAIASAGLMRMALVQAVHHARHRTVFQKRLADQPMMRPVQAEMALEVEAAIALVMRLCRSFDLAAGDPHEAARARLLTPAVKFWVCKTAPVLIGEAMECLGGNGYVEDSILPRLYREAPVNAIWEGSGNVMCLDVLRAIARDGKAARDVLARLTEEAADLPGVPETAQSILRALDRNDAETAARMVVERIALLAAVAAMRASTPPAMVEAFARTRFADRRGAQYGTANLSGMEVLTALDRALPR
jgi:putative acyl-CoA dehydrogenase